MRCCKVKNKFHLDGKDTKENIYMKKILKSIYLVLAFASLVSAQANSLFTDQEKDYLLKSKNFTFVGDPNWLPFEAYEKNGNYIGIVADHLNLIEKQTNVKFKKIVSKNWTDAINIAVHGDADIISGDAADILLNEKFKPIETYIKNPIVIVMKSDKNFILDINEIADSKIVIIKDYGYTADLYKAYPDINFVEVNNVQEALEEVSSGKSEGLLASYALVNYSINTMNYYDLKVVGSTSVTMNVTLFVNKDKPILHSIINKSIKAIDKNEHKKILNKWNTINKSLVDMGLVYKIMTFTGIFTLIILYFLRKQYIEKRYMEEFNKQLEQDVQDSLDDLNETRSIAKIGTWTLYHSDNRLVWNEHTYKIFGIEKNKIATLDDFFSAIHEDDVERVGDAFTNHIKTKEPYLITHKLLTVKNELKHVNEWCKTDFDDDGNPLVSNGIIQDITQARANELLIQEQSQEMIKQYNIAEKKLNESLKVFGDNVIASDSDLKGVIIYASQALCNITGYTEDELVGYPHSKLRHPDSDPKVFEELWKTIQSGKTWEGELKNLKKNGDYYWVRSSIMPKYDSEKNIIGYSSIRENITAEKSKEQFLANMSHELRTPLNAILGFVELIKENTHEEKILEYSSIIDASGKSLLGIIDDILDFSKIESGNISIEKIDFDVKKEINIIKSLFDAKASEKNITLSLLIDKDVPDFINTDIFRIRQVISNLLSNALKFTEENKKILIHASYSNGHLNVNVKDEGKGIAKEKLSHIFDEFAQEDISTTREFGGTGLGLTISRKLIHLLDGALQVKSELGIGSEFYFSVPALEAEPILEVLDEKIIHNFDGKKILVAEDNRTNQIFIGIILKGKGIEYDIAQDGVVALQMFQEHKYDAILMDENMPNMGGIVTTGKILEYEKENNLIHTPIIAVTANSIKGDREKFIAAGMDDYISKPIDKKKLYDKLTTLLNK